MDKEIVVSREHLQHAAALFAMMEGARKSPQALVGTGLSYTQREAQAFMDPRAARLFGQDGRQYTGGLVRRDWAQVYGQPTVDSVHIDAPLTNISIQYRNMDFIGGVVFPRVQVSKRSDKYFTFGASPWLRNDAAPRAPGSGANRTGYSVSTGNYSVITYSVEHQVPDELRENADSPLSPDRDGVQFCTDVLNLKLEKDVATEINTSGNWTTNATLSGTSQWSDFANSDPVSDIHTGIRTVLSQIARKPNTMVMGYQVFEKLCQHPDLLDRIKYTGTGDRPAMVTPQMIAELFGLDSVLVGAAIEDTATEGATASMSFVWGKHAWVGYVPPAAAINSPAAGYVFTTGRAADRYREEATKSDVIRVEEPWDTKVTAAGAGYRLINAVA